MIKKAMFYGEPTISDYREMKLDEIIREYLISKGTWDRNGNPIYKTVLISCLIDSGLFVYGLKHNTTNRKAIDYYCEKEARQRLILVHENKIEVPEELWNECNEYNKKFCKTR